MITFNNSPSPTIGVELELQLIDTNTLNLTSVANNVLDSVQSPFEDRIKQEFIQAMIEINTGICSTVSDVETDLKKSLDYLETLLAFHNATYLSSSLHPFARGRDQMIMDHPRYRRIMKDLQIVGRRFFPQGLHVHIGIDDPEKAIRVNNTMRIYLPLLLALSTSSPFYEEEYTGLVSYRTKLFEALPLAGMPDYLDGWKEFNDVSDILIKGGIIKSVKDLWWDVRPHPDFGTVEIRVCDMPTRFRDILTLTALIQALVVTIAEEEEQPDPHIQILKSNKWQAARYGLDGVFVDSARVTETSIPEAINNLYDYVRPAADMLGCSNYLDGMKDILRERTGAHRQLELFERRGNFKDVINDIKEGFFK